MASINIEKRKLKNDKDGFPYRARVRITKRGKIIDKDEEKFKNRETAQAWAKKAAKRLEEKHQEIAEGTYYAPKEISEFSEATVNDLIIEYIKHPITGNGIGRTKWFVLRALLKYDIANKLVHELTADDLIKHCETRLKEPTKPTPQTVYHDITYLHSVIQLAEQVFKIKADLSYHEKAIPTLVTLKLIGRSGERDRRPTPDELVLLEKGLKERENHRSAKIPYSDILQFSIYTAMRVGEITELYWEDVDHDNKTIIVRDRKNPEKNKNKIFHVKDKDKDKDKDKYIKKEKTKYDSLVPLLGDTYHIIMNQKEKINPEKPDLIFPYNPRSISAGWQRVRDKLGIKNLRYHDLRREAASRLIEKGYDIALVAKITGHKDINVLYNIYTKLDMQNFSKTEFENNNL
jgi:integrase